MYARERAFYYSVHLWVHLDSSCYKYKAYLQRVLIHAGYNEWKRCNQVTGRWRLTARVAKQRHLADLFCTVPTMHTNSIYFCQITCLHNLHKDLVPLSSYISLLWNENANSISVEPASVVNLMAKPNSLFHFAFLPGSNVDEVGTTGGIPPNDSLRQPHCLHRQHGRTPA